MLGTFSLFVLMFLFFHTSQFCFKQSVYSIKNSQLGFFILRDLTKQSIFFSFFPSTCACLPMVVFDSLFIKQICSPTKNGRTLKKKFFVSFPRIDILLTLQSVALYLRKRYRPVINCSAFPQLISLQFIYLLLSEANFRPYNPKI